MSCTHANSFTTPGQRHRWSAVRRTRDGMYRYCLNACGALQCNKEIPAAVRHQFEVEQKEMSK